MGAGGAVCSAVKVLEAPVVLGGTIGLTLLVTIASATMSTRRLDNALGGVGSDKVIAVKFHSSSLPFSCLSRGRGPINCTISVYIGIISRLGRGLRAPRLRVGFGPIASTSQVPLVTGNAISVRYNSAFGALRHRGRITFTGACFLATGEFISGGSDGLGAVTSLTNRAIISASNATGVRRLDEAGISHGLNVGVITTGSRTRTFLVLSANHTSTFIVSSVLLTSLMTKSEGPSRCSVSSRTFSTPRPCTVVVHQKSRRFGGFIGRTATGLFRDTRVRRVCGG